MSAHRAPQARSAKAASAPKRKALTCLAVSIATASLAVTTAALATAVEVPEPTGPTTSVTMPNPGPPNHPAYEAQRDVSQADKNSELDSNYVALVALGALGGIALAGAGLGITLAIQRRRDHTTPHAA